MDPDHVSVLAKWDTLQRVNLSGCVTTSGIAVDCQSDEIILTREKKGKKTLQTNSGHVWTTTELLSFRVPPLFLDKLPELERLYPPFEETHHGS